jgi:L-ascorbate metabolism protein UlaG (beta-lactamase superfamily)
MLIDRILWLGHASFQIMVGSSQVIYIDPFQLGDNLPKADYIFITHDHYDHCSPEDIAKIFKPETQIIAPASVGAKLDLPIRAIEVGEKIALDKNLKVQAVPSYNPKKKFHPKENENVGYLITIDGETLYHAGDTDLIPEMKDIKADIALLPVGGNYTMNAEEAAKAANMINPKIAVPMHYGSVVGTISDAEKFKSLVKTKTIIMDSIK